MDMAPICYTWVHRVCVFPTLTIVSITLVHIKVINTYIQRTFGDTCGKISKFSINI